MVRAVDPKKKRETTNDGGAAENNATETKYVPIPVDEYRARIKYALKKYDHIWRSLADK